METGTTDKKRIMFIISNLAGGGAERVTANLCNALCKTYQVCLLTLFQHPDAYALDDRVERLDFEGRGFFPRLFWVRKMKRILRPQATISMLQIPNLLNVLTGKEFSITSERADPQVTGGRYYRLDKFTYSRADHIVFQSRRVQHMFSKRIRRKSSIILNPVCVRQHAAEHPANKIVAAGRLVKEKNHRMLILAFVKFHQEHPDYLLEIYGNGPCREELECLIEETGLKDCAQIVHFARDLHEQIRDAQMLVLPSNTEGLSNVLLEAMMMGIPCISTDCAGSDEIISDGVNGLLTPVGDQEALASAMLTLAEDPSLRKKISDEAIKTSSRFREDVVAGQWIKLIEENAR